MSSPPPFLDLGKPAKDLFNKGYHHGFLKVDSTTKSGNSVEFKTAASHNLTTQNTGGNVEVKYKIPNYGLTVTEKWNTDNQMGTVIELKDQIRRGTKVTLDIGYTPHTGKHNALLKTELASELFKVNADANIVGGPVFTLSTVGLLMKDMYFGGSLKFDLSTNQLKNTSFAFGHQVPAYCLHSYVNDGREFGGSLYHKVNKALEVGAQLSWTKGEDHTRFGLASKYQVNKDFTLQGKVDNKSQVALSAIHNLSDAVKLTLTTQFGLVSSTDSSNKFGVGVEYKPCCCGI